MTNAVATPTIADGAAPGPKSVAPQAGVRPYAADDYVPGYVPAGAELLCAVRIRPPEGVDRAAVVVAGSSSGT